MAKLRGHNSISLYNRQLYLGAGKSLCYVVSTMVVRKAIERSKRSKWVYISIKLKSMKLAPLWCSGLAYQPFTLGTRVRIPVVEHTFFLFLLVTIDASSVTMHAIVASVVFDIQVVHRHFKRQGDYMHARAVCSGWCQCQAGSGCGRQERHLKYVVGLQCGNDAGIDSDTGTSML